MVACYWRMEREGEESAASGISFREEDRGVTGRKAYKYVYTALPLFTLTWLTSSF